MPEKVPLLRLDGYPLKQETVRVLEALFRQRPPPMTTAAAARTLHPGPSPSRHSASAAMPPTPSTQTLLPARAGATSSSSPPEETIGEKDPDEALPVPELATSGQFQDPGQGKLHHLHELVQVPVHLSF